MCELTLPVYYLLQHALGKDIYIESVWSYSVLLMLRGRVRYIILISFKKYQLIAR